MTRYQVLLLLLVSHLLSSCNGQSTPGYRGVRNKPNAAANKESDVAYYGMSKRPDAIDTSAGWKQDGQKILLTGVVYSHDGRPVANAILYYYHTNTEGKYLHKADEERSMPQNELGQTHGYIRGWVKTDTEGRYYIYTVRPGVYPTRDEPAHIHMTVQEPNGARKYRIDDFIFDDDELLTTAKRKKMENRGGSGVLRLVQKESLYIGERNIILGLNIPAYAESRVAQTLSGLNIGEDIFSFIPYHAWGPDKGTRTCPICKYGWYLGVLYFVANDPDWNEIKKWLSFLEEVSKKKEKYLKVYFIYGNDKAYNERQRFAELEKIGSELGIKHVALTFVPSFDDQESEIALNKISQQAKNTFILYKRSRVIGKFVNFKPVEESFSLLTNRLEASMNEYFYLPAAQ